MDPCFPQAPSGAREKTQTYSSVRSAVMLCDPKGRTTIIGPSGRDVAKQQSRRKVSMMFRTPKGCETIKNKQKRKKF
jgi:hypothetical protein